MRLHSLGREAAIIGEVVPGHPGFVTMNTRVGGRRVVDMLSSEQFAADLLTRSARFD
jgi:hydrogenase expression/formation protein HypE